MFEAYVYDRNATKQERERVRFHSRKSSSPEGILKTAYQMARDNKTKAIAIDGVWNGQREPIQTAYWDKYSGFVRYHRTGRYKDCTANRLMSDGSIRFLEYLSCPLERHEMPPTRKALPAPAKKKTAPKKVVRKVVRKRVVRRPAHQTRARDWNQIGLSDILPSLPSEGGSRTPRTVPRTSVKDAYRTAKDAYRTAKEYYGGKYAKIKDRKSKRTADQNKEEEVVKVLGMDDRYPTIREDEMVARAQRVFDKYPVDTKKESNGEPPYLKYGTPIDKTRMPIDKTRMNHALKQADKRFVTQTLPKSNPNSTQTLPKSPAHNARARAPAKEILESDIPLDPRNDNDVRNRLRKQEEKRQAHEKAQQEEYERSKLSNKIKRAGRK